MKKIGRKIVILFLIIFFIGINNSFAAPIPHYPKGYSITINNINKEEVGKIEVFTPWGYFDDYDKVEIDGRLFNYNNYYYDGVEGKKYNGVKCKIIDTINEEEIKKIENGINILLSNIEIAFNLRIYMKDGKEFFSEGIESCMIVDEFSWKDKEYMKRVKEFEKIIVCFEGNYISDDTLITMEEQPIELPVIQSEPSSNNKLLYIIGMVIILAIILLRVIYVRRLKK